MTKNGKIGIIGTEGTINSHIHTKLIKEHKPTYQVTERACPLFVPLVEEGFFLDTNVTYEIAGKYLEVMKENEVDTLILGCTHYPFLRDTIRKIMGPEVNLVNPAYETARELKKMLSELGLAASAEATAGNGAGVTADLKAAEASSRMLSTQTSVGTGMHRFCVSDGADKVAHFAKERFPFPVENVMQVNIEEY